MEGLRWPQWPRSNSSSGPVIRVNISPWEERRCFKHTWGRCRWPCPEPGDRRHRDSVRPLSTWEARPVPSSEGCSCCRRRSPCKETIKCANYWTAYFLETTRINIPVAVWVNIFSVAIAVIKKLHFSLYCNLAKKQWGFENRQQQKHLCF